MQIQTVDYRSENAPRSLAQSLRETGFAVLTNHPITAARIEAIYASWGAFFASEEKHNYLRDPVRQDGFFPFKSEHAKDAKEKDLKEFFHVYPWGQLPDELAQETRQFYGDLVGLGIELLGWLDSQLPEDIAQKLSQPLQDMMVQSAQSLLRILHYPANIPAGKFAYKRNIHTANKANLACFTCQRSRYPDQIAAFMFLERILAQIWRIQPADIDDRELLVRIFCGNFGNRICLGKTNP